MDISRITKSLKKLHKEFSDACLAASHATAAPPAVAGGERPPQLRGVQDLTLLDQYDGYLEAAEAERQEELRLFRIGVGADEIAGLQAEVCN